MPTLAERLGYTSEDRLVIVSCDDLGACHALNVGVYQSLRQGVATCASIMVPALIIRGGLDPTSPQDAAVTMQRLLVHGELDPVIPLSALDETRRSLESVGFGVTTHTSPGLGHSIDPAGLQLGERFLTQVL